MPIRSQMNPPIIRCVVRRTVSHLKKTDSDSEREHFIGIGIDIGIGF